MVKIARVMLMSILLLAGVSYSNAHFSDTKEVNKSVKLNVPSYQITFDTSGGTPIKNQFIAYNGRITPVDDPKKDGYNFMRWSPALNYNDRIRENRTYRAIWSQVTHTIEFRNNLTGENVVQKLNNGDSITPPVFTFEGHTLSWYPSVPATATRSSIHHAQWTPIKYGVIFFTNTSEDIPIQYIDYGKTATIPPNPTRKGYVFKGWTPDPTMKITGNTVFEAIWEEVITVDSPNSARGSYSNGMVWDYTNNRISLGGYVFSDKFTYANQSKDPNKWSQTNYSSHDKFYQDGTRGFYLARNPNTALSDTPYLWADINQFTGGEASFVITPNERGAMRVALHANNMTGMVGSMFNIRIEEEVSGRMNVIFGSNIRSDRNGTIDDPKGGFFLYYDDFAKRFGFPASPYGYTFRIKLIWDAKTGIDVVINDKVIVKGMWKEILQSSNGYIKAASVYSGRGGLGINGSLGGGGWVHSVDIIQKGQLAGTYTSRDDDIVLLSGDRFTHGVVNWEQSNLSGTSIELEVSTRIKGGSWSPWIKVANGGTFDVPKHVDGNVRFRANMKTNNVERNPWIANILFTIKGDDGRTKEILLAESDMYNQLPNEKIEDDVIVAPIEKLIQSKDLIVDDKELIDEIPIEDLPEASLPDEDLPVDGNSILDDNTNEILDSIVEDLPLHEDSGLDKEILISDKKEEP